MRNALCSELVKMAADPKFVFLTGDLGYKALEPLRDALGDRFINAGVAEQNMISVAAGLAREGFRPWVYSIAPFLYARPYEQIRNDICLHKLPVVLAANGGGYAYGVMGSTHHALEDYGALLGLQGMRAFVPAFAGDLTAVVPMLGLAETPCYLRLGRSELPAGMASPPYAPWRKLVDGGDALLICIGPLVGPIMEAVLELNESRRPSVWLISELPLLPEALPEELVREIREGRSVVVVEEHVENGGLGQAFALAAAILGLPLRRFRHLCARGYPSGRYGSQAFHRAESGLDAKSVLKAVQ